MFSLIQNLSFAMTESNNYLWTIVDWQSANNNSSSALWAPPPEEDIRATI
ncbi:hypothetical protein [Roseivirga pacifica]|nr:hypothetical protein [Roseivirga pacifica]